MQSNLLIKELTFKNTRSSGAGGQHVNKVSSKVILSFDLVNSTVLTENQKIRLLDKLANRLTNESILILSCDETRSQFQNKELVIERFLELLKAGLIVPKKRRPTKPSKTSVKKKLDDKTKKGLKKVLRKKPKLDD